MLAWPSLRYRFRRYTKSEPPGHFPLSFIPAQQRVLGRREARIYMSLRRSLFTLRVILSLTPGSKNRL